MSRKNRGYQTDWSWKPSPNDYIPGDIEEKNSSSYSKFYGRRKWFSLRRIVFKIYGRKCMKCGTLKACFHVDHIRPRSRYRSLELSFYNLQVLCKKCNEDKSNQDCTDYRPFIPSRETVAEMTAKIRKTDKRKERKHRNSRFGGVHG